MEAILNSRLITSISNDTNDALAFTPGLFLITKTTVALTKPTRVNAIETATLTRQMKEMDNLIDFWKTCLQIIYPLMRKK